MVTYPDECWMQVEEKQVFIKPAFSKAENAKVEKSGGKDNPPLMLHDKFSRFDFFIIVEGKSAKACIRVIKKGNEDSVRALLRKSRIAYEYEQKYALSNVGKSATTVPAQAAYQVKIFTLGGRTPAEVLATEGGEELLRKQRDFLATKVSDPKYGPMNQKQVSAIDEALRLKEQNALAAPEAAKESKQMILYKSSVHINPYQTRADGKHPCSQIEIIWTFGDKRQVMVHIRNFYAVMQTDEKGLNQFVPGTISDDVNNSVRVEAESWMDAVEIMESNLRIWERLVGAACMEDAYRSTKRNADSARGQVE